MEAELVRHLESLLATFREVDGRAESTVGRFCVGDGDFFNRLRAGEGFKVRTYDRAVKWFSENWPESAEWPDDVPRPASAEVSGSSPAPAEAAE